MKIISEKRTIIELGESFAVTIDKAQALKKGLKKGHKIDKVVIHFTQG